MENNNIGVPPPGQGSNQKAAASKGQAKKYALSAVIIIVIVAAAAAGIYAIRPHSGNNKIISAVQTVTQTAKQTAQEVLKPTAAAASEFATFKEIPVNVTPAVPTYAVKEDLSNVSNIADFDFLSTATKEMLAKNYFAVVPGYNAEFFPLYESNRYVYTPNFVTVDSMLHNYHLMFDFLLKNLEEQKLTVALKQLNAQMLTEASSQYSDLKGTAWENAAKRNLGFFTVASKLLDQTVAVPAPVAGEVSQELALIEAHQGIDVSPVMQPVMEDYSQYIPRGHYDTSDQLRAYFKSMMWYGRLTFKLSDEDQTKSAVLITLALNAGDNKKAWNSLYEPINFFVGKSDDITYYQFSDLLVQIYGAGATLQSVTSDAGKFSAFVAAAQAFQPPQINSMPIFNAAIAPDRTKEIKGFRFMGQRFTVDASIFQNLITRDVGPKDASCSQAPFSTGRMLPKGLDITAALGSAEALNILKSEGETQYACYPENMSKMQAYVAELPQSNWTQNLYWGWLYALRPLIETKGAGYPAFMQNDAWVRKDLNSFLGSWTELKHDTILYAKQVYAELGGGGDIQKKDDRGYVEPDPVVYARLASLLQMTNEGLDIRGLLTPGMKDDLAKMQTLALSLKTISEKELNGQKLSDADYELIRSYGGQLEHFWLEANKDEMAKQQLDQNNYLSQNPAAIVADVATDPNGQVLEEGTGNIANIYVIIPLDGKLKITSGGIYSYYEFPWPLSERLTDQKWRDLLGTDKAPQTPAWTSEFLAPQPR